MKIRSTLALCGTLSMLVAGIGFRPSTSALASGAATSITLANTPAAMISAQTGTVTATLSQRVNDGRITFSTSYAPAVGGVPPAGPISACTPVNGSCGMTWAAPPGFDGSVTITAAWSGDRQFSSASRVLTVGVARSKYLYTGTWQGSPIRPLTHIVPAPANLSGARPAGQLTQFATQDPAYACLNGHALNVDLAPTQFPGDYVVLAPAQGTCPAGAWLIPQEPVISAVSGTQAAGKTIHLHGTFPATRPADAGVLLLGVRHEPAPLVSWSATDVAVTIPADVLSGRYLVAMTWDDPATAATASNAGVPTPLQVAGKVLAPQIGPRVRVMDGATLKTMVPLAANAKLPPVAALQFPNPTPFLRNLKPGDIIVAGRSPSTPKGLFRKVMSAQTGAHSLSLVTGATTLHDVFLQGSYDVQGQLNAQTVRSFTPARPGVALLPAGANGSECLSIDTSLYSDGSGNQVIGSGKACVSAGLDISGYFDFSDAGASLTISGGQSIHLHLSGKGSASFDQQVSLGTFTLSPIAFAIGPVPVVIVPEVDLSVGAHGQISADIELGATEQAGFTATVGCGVKWFPPDASCDASGSTYLDFSTDPLVLKGSAQLTIFASVKLSALLYGVAGGDLEVKAYIDGNVNLTGDPWWSIGGGVQINAGFDLELFVSETKNFTLADWNGVIAQAPGPLAPPTLQLVASPTQPTCQKGKPYGGEPTYTCNAVRLWVTMTSDLGPIQGAVTFTADGYNNGQPIGSCTTDQAGQCFIEWVPLNLDLRHGDAPGFYTITAAEHSGITSQPVTVHFKVS